MRKLSYILSTASLVLISSSQTVFAKGGGGGGGGRGGGGGGGSRGGTGGGFVPVIVPVGAGYGHSSGSRSGGSALPTWAIVIIVLAVLAIFGSCIYCCLKRRKKHTTTSALLPMSLPVQPNHLAANNNTSIPVNEPLPVYSTEAKPTETVVNENYSSPPTLPPPIYANVLPDTSPNHYFSTHKNTTRELYDAGMQFSQQSPPSTNPPSAEELHYLGYHKQMALNNWLIHPALNQFVSTTLAKPSQAAPGRGESLSPVLRFHPSGNDLSIQTQFPLPASLSDLLLQETICQNNEQCPLESITSISYFEVTILSKPDPSVVFAIGLATRPYPHFRLPGWNIYSVGYHSDDGRKYVDDGYGGRNYSSSFGVGDVVGCGYDRTSGNVFFTLNGTNLGIARQGMWHLVFPTLGADGNVDVQVNFGDLPFKYQAPLGVNPQPYTPETYSMPSGPSGSTQAPIQPSANIPPKADYTPDVKMPDPKDY